VRELDDSAVVLSTQGELTAVPPLNFPDDVATTMQLEPYAGKARKNKTGYTGVHQVKRTGKYVAHIKVDGKKKSLGTYATKEEAARAYAEAKQRLEAEVSVLWQSS
jgi:hypothetical protein